VEAKKMEIFNEEVALLVGQNGPLDGKRWPLKDMLLIGRDPANDIMIPDRQVSRHHARLTTTSDGILLEDLGSKNGTHCNGKTIEEPVRLQDGDVFQIALAQQFIYISSDATVPLDVSEIISAGPVPQSPDRTVDRLTDQEALKLSLDPQSRTVFIRQHARQGAGSDGEPVLSEQELSPPLSAYQFRLLQVLVDNQERVIPRQELIAAVWGDEQAIEVSEQALDALIRRLRDRLAEIDRAHEYIVTVRGHGLRLDNPPVW
jgi:pSer/pThr/pTyr-binding forkhead associated (FHA) protein